MKTLEELNWIHTCMCANDPAVHGQLLPAPKMMAFIELVQKDASLSAYEKGIRDAAEKCSGWVLAEDAKKSILKLLDPS